MHAYVSEPLKLLQNLKQLHYSDIAHYLKKIFKNSHDDFYMVVKKINNELLSEILLELPVHIREDMYNTISSKQLAKILHHLLSDDLTDIIQEIEQVNHVKAQEIFQGLHEDDQKEVAWLKRYTNDEAGAYMQTELFGAKLDETIGESIKRLKHLKAQGELDNIHQVFITDEHNILKAAIFLEDLILFDFEQKYSQIIQQQGVKFKPFQVNVNENIDMVANSFEKYDLNVVAVVKNSNELVGRITSDDIIDVIEKNATEQMYQLAGVKEEFEREDNTLSVAKNRALWLFINLGTAILASLVIGVFDQTIQQYVALAILMPIVASMGGNAGTQTLAVMVRRLALGEIDHENSKEVIKKEIIISIFNGMLFGLVVALVAIVWFDTLMIGVVIALSMMINLFCASFFGATIPLLLKRFNIDPAIGSTVLLTTVTDIMGFFSFLGLAKIMLV
jgi:magnesium transporter